jgi:DNA-binding NarL/FixJ family response regulator
VSINKKLRVLIVDDHLAWRKTLWLVLANLPQLEVVGDAPDGESALKACLVSRPDLVLLDINMPGMDGFETAQALLAQEPGLWIIGVSAEVNPGFQQRAQDSGFKAVIPKDQLLDYLSPATSSPFTTNS